MRGCNRWAEGDKATLRALYLTVPTRELGRRLGRSVQAIQNRMRIDRLETQRIRFSSDAIAKIVELNALGLSDSEIGAQCGSDRHCIAAMRKRLGLPSNQFGARMRERVRGKTREQCETAGVSSLGEYRALVLKVRVVRSGWPSDLRWRCVQILDLLESRGPLTREDIADGIGMPWRGSRKSLYSNERSGGGSYLANLMRRGLVIKLGRIIGGRGQGANVNLYAMAIDAKRRKSQ